MIFGPPSLGLAHAAVTEAGHPELIEYLIPHDIYGVTIKSPCPLPNIAIKAVALAHQAAGHHVTATYAQGHGHFDCDECGLT